MTTIADNPNFAVELHSCGGYHDRRMACPWSTIASVTIEEIKHQDTAVDRRIQVVLDCSCRYELSLPLTTPAPRVGEPSYCRGRHEHAVS